MTVMMPGLFAAEPSRIAVRTEETDVDYRQFDERARRWLAVLAERGIEPGERVVVCLPRCVDALALALACWQRGAVFVPVDRGYPAARIRLLLDDCAPAVVFVGRKARVSLPDGLAVVVVDGQPAAEPADVGDPPAPTSPAYVLYTSGSTGRPKGVVVSHAAFAHYVSCAAEAYPGASGVSPWHSSLSFDATVTSVWVPLAVGGTVWVIPENTPLSGVEGVADLLRGPEPVGLLKVTPSLLDMLDRWLDGETLGTRIGTLVIGGEQLQRAQMAPWLARTELLVNEYGPTETTVGVTIGRFTELPDREPVPVGRPLPGTTVYLLGPDDRPSIGNAAGEICVGGPQLAEGYLNLPEETAARFRSSSALPGVRLYRTGDLGRWGPDGELHCLGRLDDQLKHRGHRIEPGEIEAALTARPGVRWAAVLGRHDRLVGYVARDGSVGGQALRAQALRDALRDELPGHLVPDELLLLDEPPLTSHGKLDRAAVDAQRDG